MRLRSFLQSLFARRDKTTINQPDIPAQGTANITFPPGEGLVEDRVGFAVNIDGRRAGCMITAEALQDRFGVKGSDLLAGFRANRSRIKVLVEALVRRNPNLPEYTITTDSP